MYFRSDGRGFPGGGAGSRTRRFAPPLRGRPLHRLPRQVRCPHLRKMLCIHPTPSEEYRSTITYESVYFKSGLDINGASNRVSNIAPINAIFRECAIEFSVADTISFTWAGAPTNHLWTANDRAQLARVFENRTKSSDVSDNNLRNITSTSFQDLIV